MRPLASIDVRSPPRARHITARRFDKRWRPFLKRSWDVEPETVAVLRDPLERLKSWYKYRNSPERRKSVAGLSFDEFIRAVVSDDPSDATRIGAQDAFVSDGDGGIGVTHLFALERPDPLDDFLSGVLGHAIVPDRLNVSAAADVDLSPETHALLQEKRAGEFALYHRVLEAGHMVTEAARP